MAPLFTIGLLGLNDAPSAAPLAVARAEPPSSEAGPGTAEPPAGSDVPRAPVTAEAPGSPLHIGHSERAQGAFGQAASSPESPAPVSRRRAIVRDLNTVKLGVSACMGRHGGNLVVELPVRMRVRADGVAERVILPVSSSGALIACVTRAIRSRRYTPGLAPETLRHVFYPREG